MEVSNKLILTLLSYPNYPKHHLSVLGVAKCQWSFSKFDASWRCGTNLDHLQKVKAHGITNISVIQLNVRALLCSHTESSTHTQQVKLPSLLTNTSKVCSCPFAQSSVIYMNLIQRFVRKLSNFPQNNQQSKMCDVQSKFRGSNTGSSVTGVKCRYYIYSVR